MAPLRRALSAGAMGAPPSFHGALWSRKARGRSRTGLALTRAIGASLCRGASTECCTAGSPTASIKAFGGVVVVVRRRLG